MTPDAMIARLIAVRAALDRALDDEPLDLLAGDIEAAITELDLIISGRHAAKELAE